MKNISTFDHCYGCGVCSVACPKKAINMGINGEGFYAPLVNGDNCIECGICNNVCAFNHKEVCQQKNDTVCAAAWSNNEDIRYNSTSGGVAYEISKHLLAENYKICGVRYKTLQKNAEHYVAYNEEQLKDMVGSKYIQSHTVDAFSSFKRGEKYAVIGTPCQIDSLRRYIMMKKMEQDFVLIDFFCHGVPSDLMWKKYLAEYGLGDSVKVKWRDKRSGWNDSYNMVFQNDKEETSSKMTQGDLFFRFFLKNRCLGKFCYDDCKYKLASSAADIRIGDLWGAKYESDEKGVNAVISFTQKGEEIIQRLQSCTVIPETLDVVTEYQMKKCASRPSSYEYVREALKTDATLRDIDRRASRIEFFLDEIPYKIKYYSRRIIICK